MQTLAYTIGISVPGDPSTASTSGGDQSSSATTPTAAGGALTSVAVPTVVTPSTTTSKPSLRQLATAPRVKRSTARTAGIRLSMRVGGDAEVVRIRVFRKLANGRRVLLTTAWRSPSRAGLYRTRLVGAELRSRLRTGSYEVEAAPGSARTSLATASRVAFKVLKS